MNKKEILDAFDELRDNDYDIDSCPSSLNPAWVESLSLLCTGDRNVIPSKEQLRMQHTVMTVSHMWVRSRPLDEGFSANRRRYSPELLARVWNEA